MNNIYNNNIYILLYILKDGCFILNTDKGTWRVQTSAMACNNQ